MTASFTQPYWGDVLQPNIELEPHEIKMIGQPQGSQSTYAASCDNTVLQGLLQEDGLSSEVLNARQAFLFLKRLKDKPTMLMPMRCRVPAPTNINVFTDGSWQYPLRYYFALGGAGIWWPDRKLKGHPISTAEYELAHRTVTHDGVRIFAPIGGFAGSSTRTELAAGILAISAHGPTHIGSDSEVFVNGANALLNNLRKGVDKQPTWKCISDGDLREHFYLAAKSKGPRSIHLTWTKGHATDKHVAEGITTSAH